VIRVLVALLGLALIALMVAEFFVFFLLPRRVRREPRVARGITRALWTPWRAAAQRMRPVTADTVLGLFGPLALIGVLAIWVVGLILGFAALLWGNHTEFVHPANRGFWDDLYFSAATFFSFSTDLGRGGGSLGNVLAVSEAASGFGVFFIAIGYLPSLYQAFSRREIAVSQLDPRAGSPPTAGALLLGAARHGGWPYLDEYLREWEEWAAELMETHLSYPILGYFRSQHVNQNWLSALTTVLDTCAVALSARPRGSAEPARLAFAIGRHAVADLALAYRTKEAPSGPDRLPAEEFAVLSERLEDAGMPLGSHEEVRAGVDRLRATYEPQVRALAAWFALNLPAWLPEEEALPNWRRVVVEPGPSVSWHG
jgi:hypothetical protein